MRYTSARYNILGKTEHLKFVFFVFFKQTLKKAIKYFEGRIHIKCPIPANWMEFMGAKYLMERRSKTIWKKEKKNWNKKFNNFFKKER